ncbi:hypothetical protein DFJ74DRAFT_710554 [Hyaloraphidium curvatum]|nr:hypothetical protein DFJ74DRAFT_710554 [Hyaloraphidium curvatum]
MFAAPGPADGASNPSDAARAASEDGAPALPTEMLLAVAQALEAGGHKRTLLNLISSCRDLFFAGTGLLVRRIAVPAPRRGNGAHAPQDAFRGLFSDALDTGKIGRIEQLSLVVRNRDPLHADLLLSAGPTLRELEIVASSKSGLSSLWTVLDAARNLRCARIAAEENPDVTTWWDDPRAADFSPLLRHLDALDSLEAVHLAYREAPRINPVEGAHGWPSALSEVPRAASRLRTVIVRDYATLEPIPQARTGLPRPLLTVMVQENSLGDWMGHTFEGIDIAGCHYPDFLLDADGLEPIRRAFPGAKTWLLSMISTSALAGFDFRGIGRMVLTECHLGLSPDSFPRVRTAVEASGTRVLIRPYAHAMQWSAAQRAEAEFWRAIAGVEVRRVGH